MEQLPESEKTKAMPAEQIRTRIAQIDQAIIAKQGTIPGIPAANELGPSLDDGSIEAESNEIGFAHAARELAKLRKEKQELEEQLQQLEKAA